MSGTQDIPAVLAGTEGFSELSSSDQARIVSMVGGVEEVVGVQHLVEALANKQTLLTLTLLQLTGAVYMQCTFLQSSLGSWILMHLIIG